MPLWKWILLFVGGLLLFIFLYGFAQGLSRPTHISWLNDIISIVWVILIIATYFGAVRLFEKRKADEFRMSKLLPQVGIGLLVGIGFFVVVVGAMALCGIYKVTAVHWNFYSLFTQLLLFLSVAVCEEVLFRGILFRFIDSRWNTWIALAVSALVFGFVHLTNSNATVWSSVAIAIEAGLLLGAAYKFSGTLWLPIGIHWAWNFVEGNVFGFAVSGNDVDSIITPTISSPDILSGGAFGAEASIFAVILGLALSAWFIWKWKTAKKITD